MSSATCWLNGTNDEVPIVRSAFSVSVKVLSTDARSDSDSTVTITMSPSPIINADAVDAVRRGFRIAFSRPSLADMLMPWIGRKGFFGPATLCLGICHDDPDVTPAEKIRMDCCVTVPDHVKAEGEVGVQIVEGGPYAVLRHAGPYGGLPDAYRWLYGTWLSTSGRELRHAPAYEVYVNNPQDTPPEKLITDIYLPLEPR